MTAILIGVLVELAYAFTIVRGQYAEYCWGGLIAGLSAISYYEMPLKEEAMKNKINRSGFNIERKINVLL